MIIQLLRWLIYISDSQEVLIVWGEQDQIFPVQLAHELKEYVSNCIYTFVLTFKNVVFSLLYVPNPHDN